MHDLAAKMAAVLRTGLCKALRRDPLTGRRISARSDIEFIGTPYGGWAVPASLFNEDSVCYCAGCGEDISFDLGLIRRFGCQVHAFDPTPRAIEYVRRTASAEANYHFQGIGLWDCHTKLNFYAPKNPAHVSYSALNLQKTQEYFKAEVFRLAELMEKNGHRRLGLLKLDIEGAEYKVIDSIIDDGLDIAVICVEYDETFNPLDSGYAKRIKGSMEGLVAAGYSIACIGRPGNYTFIKAPGRETPDK
jgi:FkbM family methyltransferase